MNLGEHITASIKVALNRYCVDEDGGFNGREGDEESTMTTGRKI